MSEVLTPRMDAACGTPTNDWSLTAHRLFAEGQQLERELIAAHEALRLKQQTVLKLLDDAAADFTLRFELGDAKAYSQQVVTTITAELNTLKAENARLIAERDRALIEVAAIRTQIHDLCHDKHTTGPVTPAEFTDGCEAFQQTLFGCSPIKDLRKANEAQAHDLAVAQRDNRHLRRIACLAHVRDLNRLYHDDGELQDSSAEPFIDWARDSVDRIQEALTARGLAALKAELAAVGSDDSRGADGEATRHTMSDPFTREHSLRQLRSGLCLILGFAPVWLVAHYLSSPWRQYWMDWSLLGFIAAAYVSSILTVSVRWPYWFFFGPHIASARALLDGWECKRREKGIRL